MKKILSISMVCALLMGCIYITAAREKRPDELWRDIASQYLANSLHDEHWKGTDPRIVGDGFKYYTNSDAPSYIEYKIACSDEPDCGFIMVNVDGGDVSIPLASTYGNTTYETLKAKLSQKSNKEGSKLKRMKLYYFWPFEQYIQDEDSQEISGNDPDKQDVHKNQIEEYQQRAREFKQSPEFKKKMEELRSKWLTSVTKKSVFSLFTSYAASVATWAPDIFVPGASTTSCPSRIPCYTQFQYSYSGWTCYSGCTPTAIAMVFAYHDRQGTYPNLVTGTAADYIDTATTNTGITTLINSIRTQIWTYCSSSGLWATATANQVNAINYAKAKGYQNAKAYYTTGTPTNLLGTIQTEVAAWRPVVVNTQTHSLVAYGYSSISVSAMIRVNYGWGRSSHPNADVSVNAIDVNGTSYSLLSLTRYWIGG